MSPIAEGVGLTLGDAWFHSPQFRGSLWQHEGAQVTAQFSGWVFCTGLWLGSLSTSDPQDTWVSSHADLVLPCVFKVWPRKSPVPRRPDATSVSLPLTVATTAPPAREHGSRSLTAVHQGSSYLPLCFVFWLGHLPYASSRLGSPGFSHTGQVVNILGFGYHKISPAANSILSL